MFLLAYETWCHNEFKNVVKLKQIDNKPDLINFLCDICTIETDKLISICEFNVYTLETKALKFRLNEKFKLEVVEF